MLTTAPDPAEAAPKAAAAPTCNVCGGSDFRARRSRLMAVCGTCGCMERTRILKMVLDDLGLPRPGMRVLHLAPEKGLSKFLAKAAGDGYEPCDIDPERYAHAKARKLDLVTDAESLPDRRYDLIVHSHVMEHVPCNITAVLFHLHRSLREEGLHLCSIPIDPTRPYAENLSELSVEEATKEFGQHDHVRRFGSVDLQRTLGMVFRMPEEYDIEKRFGAERLKAHAIPPRAWKGWTGHSHLEFRKDDLKLVL